MYLPAQFRSVPFLVSSHTYSGGQRLAVHEYPQRDLPFVEEMGEKSLELKISAYLLGDYQERRDALIGALRTAGAGELHHPYLGVLSVKTRSWSLTETSDEGKKCRIDIEFIDAGVEREITVDDVFNANAALDDLAIAAGEITINTEAITQLDGRAYVLNQVRDLLNTPQQWLNAAHHGEAAVKNFMLEAQAVRDQIQTLANAPADIANRALSLFRQAGKLIAPIQPKALPSQQARAVISRAPSASNGSSTALNTLSLMSRALVRTQAAVDNPPALIRVDDQRALTRSLQAALHLHYSATLLSAGAFLTAAEFSFYDEAMEVSRAYHFLAARAMALEGLSDNIFHNIATVSHAVTFRAAWRDLPYLKKTIVAQPMPSVVLAHRLTTDEGGLVVRNHIAHPLFCAGEIRY